MWGIIGSEIIPSIYVIVSILLYVRGLGRYFPRMSISTAAVVALFALSAAVKDLRNNFSVTDKLREKHLKNLDYCYGYGSYIGSDGAVHIGTVKASHVQCPKEVTFIGSKVERELKKRTNMKESQEPGSVASNTSISRRRMLEKGTGMNLGQ